MSTQADIPSDLTDDYKASVFQYLDAYLNSIILYALLHGIYTGITAVTLWNIFINQCWQIRRALVVVIILLYSLTTIDFAVNWSLVHFAFIQNGKSFWTAFWEFNCGGQAIMVIEGIVSSISTIITDLYMIWCCWMVWGQCQVTVLLPILFLIAATGKVANLIYSLSTVQEIFTTLYIAFVLATTLWCTLLIIYRILTVTGFKHGAVSSLHFQTASSEASTTSYREPTIESSVYEVDIEAQQEQGEELIEVVERTE
ncbi:hypothetical protein IW261DRAFT_1598239 [Armillaria novae-zelandiae]|uniref:Uncharacterized protein n=1 Tax=Armillaria novae-zelandiae TaxID=153914 RepID=A0AA39NKR5_9AGAR|nr:hypothetical protein IW261DRAFT_1598239 [Armillaria novae-zelandiae]